MYKDRSRKKSRVIAARFTERQAELLRSMAASFEISESKLINFLCFVPPATIKEDFLNSLLKEHIKDPLNLNSLLKLLNMEDGEADE